MTPMIDVLLVLIIIFMVITPLAPRGLRALVPQPAPARRESEHPAHGIVITVAQDGSVRQNQESVDLSKLGERLVRVFGAATDHALFVRAHKDVQFAAVARVIDIANGAGLNRIALMTE